MLFSNLIYKMGGKCSKFREKYTKPKKYFILKIWKLKQIDYFGEKIEFRMCPLNKQY